MLKKEFYALLAATMMIPAGTATAETSENPLPAYTDGAPVVLSGTINEVREDEFDLNYGAGTITVELDDWSWKGNETRFLSPGQSVTVTGSIDDDLFEGREVEADNMYLPDAYMYYYRNNFYPQALSSNNLLSEGSYVSMRGTVSDISGREFTLTGRNNTTMRVNASDLGYDPFDNDGLQKIMPGDSVHVYGEIDDDFFENREIEADSIVVLSQVGNAG